MSQPASARQRQLFVLFLLALLAAGKVLQPCFDNDTWWHLRVGQFIAAEKRLPTEDPFSQLGREQHAPWVAYSWLHELLLYECFQLGGNVGVLALRYALVMMSWGGIAWFLLRHARNPWLGLLLLALVSISLRPFSSERPWHFTIFFTTLTLHAVIRVREGAAVRRFAWLPIVYVLWANIHIQFVMGFAILGLAWFSAVLEGYWQNSASRKHEAWLLFWLGAACALATLANPFHLRLYGVIWEYATQTKALGLVMELQPPDLAEWWSWPMIALALGAAYTTSRRGFRIWDLALLAAALFFSLRMQRDLWFGVLTAAAVILNQEGTEEPVRPGAAFGAWIIALLSLGAIVMVSAAWEFGLSRGKTIATTHQETYPVEATEFVKEHRPPGPLFNNFDWGGYLIWALPEYPVSIDGRTNLYGEQRLQRSFKTWNAEGWEDDPDLQKAGVIIAPNNLGHAENKDEPGPALTEVLRRHPEQWRIAHEDKTAVVFVRPQ
jgi:hypothetical protein